MTNIEMLARMRTMLDEATTVLYNDTTELYPALSLAQIEMGKVIVTNFLAQGDLREIPLAIQGLISISNGTVASGSREISVGFAPIGILSVQWNSSGALTFTSPYAVKVGRDIASKKLVVNSLVSDGVFYSNLLGVITLYPDSTDNSAEAGYTVFKVPVDITASVQPLMDDVAHDAIIERALWILLKDRETEQAQLHLQLYGNLLGGLMK